MTKTVVVVESPAKAKTINKYLGKDYQVLASYGHVRDLIPKEGAVDPEHDFAMQYAPIERNAKHVQAIAKALKKADQLYLATDPDREGEAIAWHLTEQLREIDALGDRPVKRVVFHEITKSAVLDAINHPTEVAMPLVNAQQARRALDYLVGFNISPLLWRKVQPGLSAGRVQSPALRMIAEREREIEKFVPQEYWTIAARAGAAGQAFEARLARYQGEKVEQFSFVDEQQATAARAHLRDRADGVLVVANKTEKQRRRNPAAPFTTSTLQQEASRKLGYGTQRTMRIAQGLYEGVAIDGEITGLITYMRTDSVSLAQQAVDEIRQYINATYGKDQLPGKARTFKTKSRNAQEAHEAIRPTSATLSPEAVAQYLDTDQLKLYSLIWRRAVASQMAPAVYDQVAFDLLAGSERNSFRATGSTLVFPGFLAVYQDEKSDDKKAADDTTLPPVSDGDKLLLEDVLTVQHFTEPPPRYSEASLVKTLEEYGIGRPSTYASIIATLLNRGYVELEDRRFHLTDVGRIVSDFLSEHFGRYVDYEFTAQLEDQLDAVSRDEARWRPVLTDFWEPFKAQLDEKANLSREEVSKARLLGTDPKSGRPVSVRLGRYGPFVQIGTKDDEDKPKFAGLRPGQKMDEIALEEALALFQLPRDLGTTDDGIPLSTNIGRFGPYVRYGDKFASLPEGDDPYTLTLERAKQVVAEKIAADKAKILRNYGDAGIQILKGRWGPYITDGEKNARLPKDADPSAVSLEEAREMLAKAPAKKKRAARRPKKTARAK